MMALVYGLLVKGNALVVQPFKTAKSVKNGLPRERYPVAANMHLKQEGTALPKSDRRILMAIAMTQGRTGAATIGSGTVSDLLPTLCETGRAFMLPTGHGPVSIGDTRLQGEAIWESCDSGLTSTIRVDGAEHLLPGAPPYAIVASTTLCEIDCDMPARATLDWRHSPTFDTAETALEWFEAFSEDHPEARPPAPPDIETQKLALSPTMVAACRTAATPGTSHLEISFEVLYCKLQISVDDSRDTLRFFESGRMIECERDRKSEAAGQAELIERGFKLKEAAAMDLFSHASEESVWNLPPEAADSAIALGQTLPGLSAAGWIVQMPEAQDVFVADDDQWYSDLSDKGRGYFAVEVGIHVDGQRINILPVVCTYLGKRRHQSYDHIIAELERDQVALTEGDTTIIVTGQRLAEVVSELFELFGTSALNADGHVRLSQWRVGELSALATLQQSHWEAPEKLRALASTIRNALDVQPVASIDGLHADLRDYQAQGIGWLQFLSDHDLGGVLADDMGLGKTIQVLGYLLSAKANSALGHPALVIAPTSVVGNWNDEALRFTPDLKVQVLQGADRHEIMQEGFEGIDVVVTSYALLWRDAAFYSETEFSVAVLDEAQFIKNPRSKVAQAACAINATQRFALTGTPVENHLTDLWSLFHFVLPGFLGGLDAFRTTLQNPIEKDGAEALMTLLANRVRPLLLRRRKSDVLKELPPCTTIVQRIDLTERQMDRYETVRLAMTARVRDEMRAKGYDGIAITILDALLKLRQICNDPRLGKSGDRNSTAADSAKLAWLSDALPEMVEEGRRILLFSQFTSMLTLIKTLLSELNIPYVEITGSTKDRQTPISAFQSGKVPLFLISLKAGGTGLNLAAADTVIHYDPWWNPAVEQQATDRAHRIGQDNHVFVYKLIARGSVEERILSLQEEKRARAESLLPGSAAGGGLTLDEADVEALLAPMHSLDHSA